MRDRIKSIIALIIVITFAYFPFVNASESDVNWFYSLLIKQGISVDFFDDVLIKNTISDTESQFILSSVNNLPVIKELDYIENYKYVLLICSTQYDVSTNVSCDSINIYSSKGKDINLFFSTLHTKEDVSFDLAYFVKGNVSYLIIPEYYFISSSYNSVVIPFLSSLVKPSPEELYYVSFFSYIKDALTNYPTYILFSIFSIIFILIYSYNNGGINLIFYKFKHFAPVIFFSILCFLIVRSPSYLKCLIDDPYNNCVFNDILKISNTFTPEFKVVIVLLILTIIVLGLIFVSIYLQAKTYHSIFADFISTKYIFMLSYFALLFLSYLIGSNKIFYWYKLSLILLVIIYISLFIKNIAFTKVLSSLPVILKIIVYISFLLFTLFGYLSRTKNETVAFNYTYTDLFSKKDILNDRLINLPFRRIVRKSERYNLTKITSKVTLFLNSYAIYSPTSNMINNIPLILWNGQITGKFAYYVQNIFSLIDGIKKNPDLINLAVSDGPTPYFALEEKSNYDLRNSSLNISFLCYKDQASRNIFLKMSYIDKNEVTYENLKEDLLFYPGCTEDKLLTYSFPLRFTESFDSIIVFELEGAHNLSIEDISINIKESNYPVIYLKDISENPVLLSEKYDDNSIAALNFVSPGIIYSQSFTSVQSPVNISQIINNLLEKEVLENSFEIWTMPKDRLNSNIYLVK